MGNRQTAGATGTAASGDDEYTVNALNQYPTKENNTVRVLGTAAAAANVTASGATVTKTDRSFAADVLPVNNSAGPATGNVTVESTLLGAGPGGSNLLKSLTRPWQIAKQLQSFTYDLDGNLIGDGVWDYQYDGANRLIRMASTAAAVSAGFTNYVLEFKYDYMGRRVQKRSNNVTAGTNVYTRYLYDGWNVVAEFNAPSGTSIGSLQRSFTWGLDLADSGSATGGVGALLQLTDHATSKSYFPSYDGNGNVAALVDSANGSLAAVYEYSPFGELLRAEGAYAASNSFRFSTKWLDAESGLSYYGLRYYSAGLGRFINRDPIEENGGINLYGFVNNNAVNGVDALGLLCLYQDDIWVTTDKYGNVTEIKIVSTQLGCTGDWPSQSTKDRNADNPSQHGHGSSGSTSKASNKKLSKKKCDELAAKIGNNHKTLAGMIDTVSRESIADRIMGTVMEGLDQSMSYSDMAENFAEGGYRLGKAGLDAVGARGARKALTSVYSGGGAKVINAVGVVNNVWDAAQVGRALYNRDGLGIIQSSAGLASDFVTAVPAFKMAISGFKFVWDGESQRAQNDIEMADLTSIAANGQAANLNAMIGLKNVAQWKKEFVDGGCK